MVKTALDIEMEKEGWVKYSNIEKDGLSGMDVHDKELMAILQANDVGYSIKDDPDIDNSNNCNSLYIKQEDYKKIVELCTKINIL